MKTLLLTLTLAICGGCALDDTKADETVGTTVQALTGGSLNASCNYYGGTYWCQDYYTAKWCTNATTKDAWDYTRCTWTGWNASGEFCGTNVPGYSAGWEWGQNHVHCD